MPLAVAENPRGACFVAEDPLLCFALTLAVALKATSAERSHRGLWGGESSCVGVFGGACVQQGEERHMVSWSDPRRGGVCKWGEAEGSRITGSSCPPNPARKMENLLRRAEGK